MQNMQDSWNEFSKKKPDLDNPEEPVVVAYRDYPDADLEYKIMTADEAYTAHCDINKGYKYVAWKSVNKFEPKHIEYKKCKAIYAPLNGDLTQYREVEVEIPYFEENFFKESIDQGISGPIKVDGRLETHYSLEVAGDIEVGPITSYICSPTKYALFIKYDERAELEVFKDYIEYRLQISNNYINSYKTMYDQAVERKEQYQNILNKLLKTV